MSLGGGNDSVKYNYFVSMCLMLLLGHRFSEISEFIQQNDTLQNVGHGNHAKKW